MKCFFWVTPTRKLYDLCWAIHSMKEQIAAGGSGAVGEARSDVPAAAGGVTISAICARFGRARVATLP